MSTTIILIIVYIVSVILANLCTILDYKTQIKKGAYLSNYIPTIGGFIRDYNICLIINFIPIINFISIIMIGSSLLWNIVKNIRL